MKRILISLLLVVPSALAQISTFEQIPTLVQAQWNQVESLAYPKNVTSGHVLWACYHSRNSTVGPTIADAIGGGGSGTWTQVFSIVGTDGRDKLRCWTSTAASSGADTITITVTGTTDHVLWIGEWSNVTETVDVSATAQASFSGGAITLPTVVTTKYRDLVCNFVQSVGNQGMAPALNSGYQPLMHGDGLDDMYIQCLVPTTNPGSTTNTLTGDSNTRSTALATVAFKSSASLAVSTAAIPDAVVNATYSFRLGAKGGAGTNTWDITSGALPGGMSLSSAGVLSGPCTGSNPNSITFRVTDSASATATNSLTVQCATSANTIAHIQDKKGISPLALSSNVTSSNTLLITEMVNSTAQAAAFLYTDTQGTIFYPVPNTWMSQEPTHAAVKHYIGFVTSSGADSVTCGAATTCGTFMVTEFSNIQPIFDTTVTSILNSTGGGATITSTAITSPVAETLFGAAVAETNGATAAPNSPFTQANNNGDSSGTYSTAYDIGAAAGSNTASWAVTLNTSNNWMIDLFGLRPTTTGTASTGGIHHKVKQD